MVCFFCLCPFFFVWAYGFLWFTPCRLGALFPGVFFLGLNETSFCLPIKKKKKTNFPESLNLWNLALERVSCYGAMIYIKGVPLTMIDLINWFGFSCGGCVFWSPCHFFALPLQAFCILPLYWIAHFVAIKELEYLILNLNPTSLSFQESWSFNMALELGLVGGPVFELPLCNLNPHLFI